MIPPGQKARTDFPRFGLPPFAEKFPKRPNDASICIEINNAGKIDIKDALAELPRAAIQSDFHCVTTWTYRGAKWGGVRFKVFYLRYVETSGSNASQITGAVFYGQDGYRTTLLLEDILDENVLLADSFDGQPLSIEHGAPLRLVAPEHYGYKNLKHLTRIEFYTSMPAVKCGILAFLDHPRARVQKEERGRWIPGWILRYVYRLLIPSTVKQFRVAMQTKNADKD